MVLQHLRHRIAAIDTLSQLDDRMNCFPTFGIGDADHTHCRDIRVGEEGIFNL
jgi:hypothetical protein